MSTKAAGSGTSLFHGLSTLRAEEKKKDAGVKKDSALQQYLKKYTDDSQQGEKKKKKKKKAAVGAAIKIVDEDVSGFGKARSQKEDEGPGLGDDACGEEDTPTIANIEEAKALAKQLEKAKNYYDAAPDGSGWVQEAADRLASRGEAGRRGSPDISPPRRTGAARLNFPDISSPRRASGAERAAGYRASTDLSSPCRNGTAGRGSPDLSPPRRGAAAAGRAARNDSLDLSPLRRGAPTAGRAAWHDSPDLSPPRRGAPTAGRPARHDSPDLSPPRRADSARGAGRPRGSPTPSTPRKGHPHGSADLSPPCRPGVAPSRPPAGAPLQPPGRLPHDSQDLSPPRRGAPGSQAGRPSLHEPFPPSRFAEPSGREPSQSHRYEHMKHLDASPPWQHHAGPSSSRHRERHDSPSPPPQHRPRSGRDRSPVHKRTRRDTPEDDRGHRHKGRDDDHRRHGHIEPAEKRRRTTPDVSPPRRAAAADERRPRMLDGTVAGLVSSKELAEETQRLRAEAEQRRLQAVGRNAETVYRDRQSGRIVSKDEFVEQRKKKEKKKEEEDQHLEWRGGLAQKQELEEQFRRMQEEATKPFARHGPDEDYDAELRERERFGDPMVGLVKKKKQPEAREAPATITERYDAEAIEKSGFIIPQGIPPHSWLKRGVAAPPNRYNIKPGRHWDGVDRSNGFEKQLFIHQSNRRAQELEARMWSQADM